MQWILNRVSIHNKRFECSITCHVTRKHVSTYFVCQILKRPEQIASKQTRFWFGPGWWLNIFANAWDSRIYLLQTKYAKIKGKRLWAFQFSIRRAHFKTHHTIDSKQSAKNYWFHVKFYFWKKKFNSDFFVKNASRKKKNVKMPSFQLHTPAEFFFSSFKPFQFGYQHSLSF